MDKKRFEAARFDKEGNVVAEFMLSMEDIIRLRELGESNVLIKFNRDFIRAADSLVSTFPRAYQKKWKRRRKDFVAFLDSQGL